MFNREKKRRRRLDAAFGKVPDVYYTDGDMDRIRAWYDWRREREPESYAVDDVTWHDLDMDRVFRRINPGLSTPGEQVLYDTLRHPALTAHEYEARARFIRLMESDGALRLKAQVILDKLGRTRRADLCTAFQPEPRGFLMLAVYSTLAVVLVAAFVLGLLGVVNITVALMLFPVNFLIRDRALRRVRREFDTVNYCVSQLYALRRIRRLDCPALDRELRAGYAALDRMKAVLSTGGVASMENGGAGDLLASALLLDLIAYEYLKNRLWTHHEDLTAVFDALGRLDTAIAAASWRQSMPFYAVPELTFEGDIWLQAAGIVHPLLQDAVPNDLDLGKSMLLTGSNASGKSTYLRAVILNALLAQSLCTAAAERWRGRAFTLYTSMALSDDLMAGESYYVTEIKSIRRILAASGGQAPLLCAVDEVLRGTNTAERVAASSAILEQLSAAGAAVIAATHDLELCTLLADEYRMFHFQETVGQDQMLFDYKLRPGPAHSRNAIRLLGLMGFAPELVQEAECRAKGYLDTGKWTKT